jgi:hypothetical protein
LVEVQLLNEVQQQLRQRARGTKSIHAGTVIPSLVKLQLQLWANQLYLQLLGLLALFMSMPLLFFALQQKLLHNRSRRCTVFW